jgi:hypothetical protein
VAGYVTVRTREAAGGVADALAGRGHRLVAVRTRDHRQVTYPFRVWYDHPSPETDGWWDVLFLAEDPDFDLDSAIWYAREEKEAVAAIARSFHGYAGTEWRRTRLREHWTLFPQASVTHRLAPAEALRRRQAALDRPPARPPRLPVAPEPDFTGGGDGSPVVDVVRDLLARLHPGHAEILEELDLSGAASPPDPGDLLAALSDVLFPAGSPEPREIGWVPFAAALAGHDALTAADRADLVTGLFGLAVHGRAALFETADRLVALGRPIVEGRTEAVARLAVERAVPDVLSRWDLEPDGGRFALAALAAACPLTIQLVPAGFAAGVAALRDRYAGTRWGRAADLVLALLAGDDDATASATARLREACDADFPTPLGSPYAPVPARALWTLRRFFG